MANTTKLTPMQKEELNDKLIAAAEKGDVESVKGLIGKWADVDATDKYGWTALHWAALYGHTDVAKILVGSGADMEVQDNEGGRRCITLVRRDMLRLRKF